MYNAANKLKTLATTTLAAAALTLGSCGSGTDNGAHALADSIRQSIDSGHYTQAIALIDTLNARYPDSIALRKTMMAEKARAQVLQAQSQLPQWTMRADSLEVAIAEAGKEFVTKQTSAAMTPYLVHRDAAATDLAANRTAIQPRVVDADTPWLIAATLVSAKAPATVSLNDATGNILAQATISADACVHSDGTWRFTIGPEAAAPFAQALEANTGNSATITITDTAGKAHAVAISPTLAHAITASEHLAALRTQQFHTLATCEKLQRRLQLARDQQANDGQATSSLPTE